MPSDSGSLVGNRTADSYSGFEPGSQPHQMFRGDRFVETLTLAEAAMRYVLVHDAVRALFPGMKTLDEGDMNIRYCNGAGFPPELMARLAAHA